jgi:protein-tyrosine-phosphatase
MSAKSAGVDAEVGDGATPNAVRALQDARGLSLRDHTPRDVSTTDLDEADYIVAMSPAVARRLRNEHDVDPDVLTVWAIPDPYGGSLGDYRGCLEQISAALDDFLR